MPYIQRNITATRAAYNLNNIKVHTFSATKVVPPSTVAASNATLHNIRLWDPDPTISLQTFQRQESIRTYYNFPSLGVDRYAVNGQLTPVLIGVREITPNIPSPTWVNTHLQFTHGYGAVVSLANQASSGSASYAISGLPPTSTKGLPKITQPDVYFGLGESSFAIVNTKQAEVDYQRENNSNVESHYKGTGGVQLNSLLTRAAFALRLGSFNLLISDQITSKSRVLFVRDPVQMAQKAAPFLSFDADPYAVIDGGHIDWVVDGYTTTDQYPYSQNANSQQVPLNNGLPGSYNYVRNSVKVVIDAYSGQMTFYAMPQKDPILEAYEAAFPHMFQPLSKMSANLQAHLRYPEDIFSIQSAIYGRYHLTSPAAFYSSSDTWQLSQTAGAGPKSQSQLQVNTVNSQGQVVSTNPARMAPIYQEEAIPGSSTENFTITEAFVPAAQSNSSSESQNFNLTAFMIGNSDPGHYGQINVYQTPPGTTGPANADAEIVADNTVSKDISLLDRNGSEVLLGNTLMVPIGQSMIYLRPLYVAATSNPQPTLNSIIGVLGPNVYIESTLQATLTDIFKTGVSLSGSGQGSSSSGGTLTGSVPAAVQNDLTQAQADYKNAQTDLSSGNLGAYQTDITAMDSEISAAQQAAQAANAASGSSSTTTTTAPKSKTSSGTKSSTSKTTVPSRTAPKSSSTTTSTLASAAAKR